MNKLMSLLAVLLFTAMRLNTHAQGPDDGMRGEKIRQLRIAFITQKLDLTPEEAEKFWPVFNQFDKKKMAGRDELRDIGRSLKEDVLSEKELLDKLARGGELRKQEADIDYELAKAVLPVLGAAKVQILARLEIEFREQLMNTLRERRRERMGSGGPGQGDQGKPRY